MAFRGQVSEARRPAPRLYLVIPQQLAGHADLLAQALGAGVAAALVYLPDADQRTQIDQVKAVAPCVQERGVALLLAEHPELAAPTGADGAHLNGIEALKAVLPALRPARKGSPIAQNRLANILAIGRGVAADPVTAIKWHIVAKAGGVGDIPLDTFMQKQTPEIRAAGEKAAKPWLDTLKELRDSRS